MFSANAKLPEQCKIVQGLGPITPSSSTPDYVSLKNYARMSVIISVDNSTVTGSAITLKQASAVAGTGEKALGFAKYYANTDTAAGDTLTLTTATSNTFTTDTTNAKNLLYVIDIEASDLDVDGGFDCVRAGTANAANTVLDVVYVLYPPRYSSPAGVAAITD